MILHDFFSEAANPAQQAAIAIAMKKAHKKPKSMKEAVNRGDWVRHPDNQWQVGQIQSIDNGQALVTWKKTDKRRKAVSSTHHVNDLQHARREFSQLSQPTHQKQNMAEGANPADTLYFFDVARGGRSFDHLDLKIMGLRQTKSGKWYYQPGRDSTDLLTNASLKHLEKTLNVPARAWQRPTTEDQMAEACWPGYHKQGMKTMFGKQYPDCRKNKKKNEDIVKEFVEETVGQKNSDEIRRIQQMLNKKFGANLDVDGVLGSLTKQSIEKFLPDADTQPAPDPKRTTRVQGLKQKVTEQQCPECGGPMFSELMINEKQDACYYKVKSRYKVWPSAYASGALVQCRKKGAANWGNKSK